MKAGPAVWLAVAALACCLFLMIREAWSEETLWPGDPGKSIESDGKLLVDTGYVSDGYFWAAVRDTNKHRLKLRVIKGDQTLTYDLNGDAEYECFPLQLGSGDYEISLYENVSGKKYAGSGKLTIYAGMENEDSCFLIPNQYVHYTPSSEAVLESETRCAGMSAAETYTSVCDFMTGSFVYDFIKALTIQAGQLPEIDECFATRKGVCQDLSAVMCCMLRTRGVPARLMIGYADSNYHAWVEFRMDGKDYFFDPTAAINGIGKVNTYSVERYY